MSNKILLKIIIFSFSFLLIGCNNHNSYLISGNAFGTIYHIQIESDKKVDNSKLESNINNIIYNIDIIASNYSDSSEISRFNNLNSTNFIFISHHLFELLKKANQVSNLTDGYFDITVGDQKIKKGFYINPIEYVKGKDRDFNYKDIILSEERRSVKKKKKNINIDLSGIAKGYAVDLITNYLISIGINNFIINIGGEIKAHTDNEEYIKISIDDPSKKNQSVEDIFLNKKALATSGTYQDHVEYKGNKISHIVNPKNLKNVSDLSRLVAVIHDSCATADAIATGLIAMEANDIVNFANKKDIALMFLREIDGIVEKKYSKQFIKYLSEKD